MISPKPSASLKESLERRVATYQGQMTTEAAQYFVSRGIDRATAIEFRLGFVAEPLEGDEYLTGRVVIPNLGPTDVHSIKYRLLGDGPDKYLFTAGTGARMFNPRAVVTAGNIIAITEGEIDCITLNMIGVPAVGIPGVRGWKKHYRRIFTGFHKVYVVGDNDDKRGEGKDFQQKVASEIYGSVCCNMSKGHDVNSLFVEQGREAVLNVLGIKGLA